MAKKVIKLTEKDLTRLIKRVISEQPDFEGMIDKMTGMGKGNPQGFLDCIKKQFDPNKKQFDPNKLPEACKFKGMQENPNLASECIVALLAQVPEKGMEIMGCAMSHNLKVPK